MFFSLLVIFGLIPGQLSQTIARRGGQAIVQARHRYWHFGLTPARCDIMTGIASGEAIQQSLSFRGAPLELGFTRVQQLRLSKSATADLDGASPEIHTPDRGYGFRARR
jgi:hypothetical protein